MSHATWSESHARYDDLTIAQQILFESRQHELDILESLTGEVLKNELKPTFVSQLEDIA